MSEAISTQEFITGPSFNAQIDRCQELVGDIIFDIDTDEYNHRLQRDFEKLKQASENLPDDVDEVVDISRYLKRILLIIAEERGYHDKLIVNARDGKLRDDLMSPYYWFKLYSEFVLTQPQELRHEFALRGLEQALSELYDRRVDQEHGTPSPDVENDVAPIGFAILAWCLLEDVLNRWQELINTDSGEIEPNVDTLDSELVKYGIIKAFNHDNTKGYVTLYYRGEGGDGVAFYVDDVDGFLPAVGDIVTVTESDDYDTQKGNNKAADRVKRPNL
jgi:hypothetical protein